MDKLLEGTRVVFPTKSKFKQQVKVGIILSEIGGNQYKIKTISNKVKSSEVIRHRNEFLTLQEIQEFS